MERSTGLGKLAKALIEAQKEFEPIPKDSDNPYYKSKYASLDAVIAGTQTILNKHGLSILQFPMGTAIAGRVGLQTLLLHESGEFILEFVISDIPTPTTKEGVPMNPIQEVGKTLTYLRRYSIGAVLNLATEEDTDGEPERKETKKKKAASKKPAAKKKRPEVARPFKWGELLAVMSESIIAKTEEYISDPPTDEKVKIMRKVLAKHLTDIFDKDDTKRYEYCQALVGTASTKEMTPATLSCLLSFLKVKSFGDEPDGMALEEISKTFFDAAKHAGNLDMFDEEEQGEE